MSLIGSATLRTPGNPPRSITDPFDERTLARLAPALEVVSLDFEVAFYERARRRDPDSGPVLEALGHAYTQSGRLEDGLTVDRRLVELRPGDPIARYNLACSHALLGDKSEALDALERAIELGYDDREHLEKDSDLDSLRSEPRFVALIARLS